MLKIIYIICPLILLLFFIESAPAKNYHGRFTTGSYVSKETFKESYTKADSNDVAIVSNRLFFNISEFQRKGLEVTTDLRDKHDFFEKVDREKLELTGNNTFQVRQLSLLYNSNNGLMSTQSGRFPIPSAGAVNVDGLNFNLSFNSSLTSGVYGGFNPQNDEVSYLEFNQDAKIYGGYFLYQSTSNNWDRYAYLVNAITIKQYKSEIDRTFLYHNMVWQKTRRSRLITLLNLDFVPNTNVQNAMISFYRQISILTDMTASIYSYDVIEYKRRREIRERLEASPYREARIQARLKTRGNLIYSTKLLHGEREKDDLTNTTISAGFTFKRFINRHFTASYFLGHRNKYGNEEYFLKSNIGYFSSKWEFMLDNQTSMEQKSGKKTDYPIVTEFSTGYIYSKTIFITLALHHAMDQYVDIYGGYLRLSYRFGNTKTANIRDGAAPMETL